MGAIAAELVAVVVDVVVAAAAAGSVGVVGVYGVFSPPAQATIAIAPATSASPLNRIP